MPPVSSEICDFGRIWEDEKSNEFKRNGGGSSTLDIFGSTIAPPYNTTANANLSFADLVNQTTLGARPSDGEAAGWTGREAELAAEVEKMNNMRSCACSDDVCVPLHSCQSTSLLMVTCRCTLSCGITISSSLGNAASTAAAERSNLGPNLTHPKI
jgi:hypothetical protein